MKYLVFSILSLMLLPLQAYAKEPAVVTSIAPVHSLVQGVMGDTGQAALIVEAKTSPHEFQLKPSQVKLMTDADIVFFVDPLFEVFMDKSLSIIPDRVKIVQLSQMDDIKRLKIREGGVWEGHNHHEDNHDDEHHHEDDHHDNHEEHVTDNSNETGHHLDNNSYMDMHIWLDTDNARQIIRVTQHELGVLYPDNRSVYQQNALALLKRMDELDDFIASSLQGLSDKPFIVFHDAYQYFETQNNLSAVGSITIDSSVKPSIKRIQNIRQKIRQAKAVCVFSEPQSSNRIVKTVTDQIDIKTAELDPLGYGIETNAGLYFNMMKNLTQNFKKCLS